MNKLKILLKFGLYPSLESFKGFVAVTLHYGPTAWISIVFNILSNKQFDVL